MYRLDELSHAAKKQAEERIESLTSYVVEHFANRPELFQAFGEPDFQYSLQDAGRVAASNDEDHTEQLLIDLLANRAEKGDSSRTRLVTSQAIKAADKLSSNALTGVTALWSVQYLSWSNPHDMLSHLGGIVRIADTLVNLGLPSDRAWMEDADALNLLRTSIGGIVTRKTYSEMVQDKMAAHLVAGIDAKESTALLTQVEQVAPGFVGRLQAHPLKEGFLILPGNTKEELVAIFSSAASSAEFNQLAEQNGYGARDSAAIEKLNELIGEVPVLDVFAQWWDPLPLAELTIVGDVIGFLNAGRCMSFEGAKTVSEFLALRSS
jgi:hypothetical protein